MQCLVLFYGGETRPSILCVTHQMSCENRSDLVGSTVRCEMMNYKVLGGTESVWGDTG